METQTPRLELPGFGKPLAESREEEMTGKFFLHALSSYRHFASDGLKVRETRMMEFMNQITDKPEWDRKVFDEDIVKKWHEEAMGITEQDIDLDEDVYMSEKMFNNCIKELRDKAAEFRDTGLVSILDAEVAVAKSDSAISASLTEQLKAAVKVLEDVPEHQKDWHPGSNDKVLDLLHPSLFPMVYGTSRVLPHGKVPLRGCAEFSGSGEVYAVPKMEPPRWRLPPYVFGSTQWLPSDIAWTKSGGAQITSYINNLHPDDHHELYGVLEQFVAAAVPLWEMCLYKCFWPDAMSARLTNTTTPRISVMPLGDEEDFYFPEGVVYDRPPLEEDEDEDDYLDSDEYFDWKMEHRVLTWPEPGDYDPTRARSPEKRPNLRSQFPDGLQVIFKLANIHLTPSDPKYDGGSLHIEGVLNDRIVATALFYYDYENITESVLTFHHPVNSDDLRMHPPQSEFTSLERWLGINSEDAALQRLGRVVTKEGRFIAFPNVLAHQVQPFELEDKSRPGHRKILAMFLVDPHTRVLSTSVVPPQRKDWWAREVRKVSPLKELPREIFDLIIGYVHGFPMSWEDALDTRELLMRERTWVKEGFDLQMEENTYNFCEH
ncbi:hypothetical protein NPX13_g4456 [Xylaria arbuscula]|uniref:Uncharacterized protein n=1 Tax=Xylaria arbuscula TaxID=114810 RepID=A0A9W8TNB9_9PEZI|nr:hypothetical protein NPX13_g4456 [Xylaria arbuscula]